MELVGAGTDAGRPAVYRPRQPRNSPLYQLLEAHYEEVKALWEERFKQTYGRWRGFLRWVALRSIPATSHSFGGSPNADDCRHRGHHRQTRAEQLSSSLQQTPESDADSLLPPLPAC